MPELDFPIPTRIYESYRYDAKTYVWDGVAWYIDRTAGDLEQTLTPAVIASLLYPLPVDATVVQLLIPDLFGNTYGLANTAPFEPVLVHLNGVRLPPDDGSGLVGDYIVDYLANEVILLQPTPRSALVQIDILLPPERAVAGSVNVRALLDFDVDWTDPLLPTGLQDGVNTVFPLYYDSGAPRAALTTDAAQVAIFVDGVRQRPGVDYETVAAELTMTVAPTADAAFWGVFYEPASAAPQPFVVEGAWSIEVTDPPPNVEGDLLVKRPVGDGPRIVAVATGTPLAWVALV